MLRQFPLANGRVEQMMHAPPQVADGAGPAVRRRRRRLGPTSELVQKRKTPQNGDESLPLCRLRSLQKNHILPIAYQELSQCRALQYATIVDMKRQGQYSQFPCSAHVRIELVFINKQMMIARGLIFGMRFMMLLFLTRPIHANSSIETSRRTGIGQALHLTRTQIKNSLTPVRRPMSAPAAVARVDGVSAPRPMSRATADETAMAAGRFADAAVHPEIDRIG
jgi:hypothetical protein